MYLISWFLRCLMILPAPTPAPRPPRPPFSSLCPGQGRVCAVSLEQLPSRKASPYAEQNTSVPRFQYANGPQCAKGMALREIAFRNDLVVVCLVASVKTVQSLPPHSLTLRQTHLGVAQN